MIDIMREIETYILNHWLETGNEPSIEDLIARFGATEDDLAPLVIDDDDEYYYDD